jgi:hypothetical protein
LLASSSYSHLAFCYENPTADVKLKISFGNPDKQYGYRSNWVKIKRVRKQKSAKCECRSPKNCNRSITFLPFPNYLTRIDVSVIKFQHNFLSVSHQKSGIKTESLEFGAFS